MKVAITSADSFVAPYISEMLGESAVNISDEMVKDQTTLDAMLSPCQALIHINSRPVDTTVARDNRESLIIMREAARPILDAVDRHGSIHLIIIGTLRVHPQWMPGDDYYGLDSTLAPRDVAAEGQLWMEENALERAEAERPVSVIRASNVQGIPLSGPPGNGIPLCLANLSSMLPIPMSNVSPSTLYLPSALAITCVFPPLTYNNTGSTQPVWFLPISM